MKKLLLIAALFCPSLLLAQTGNFQTILISGTGRPIAGVNVAVCSIGLATTGAAVLNNIATLTMASNPITAGFVNGKTLTVSGFTGGDAFFNVSAPIVGTSATTISFSLVHANAAAGTNGKAFQTGDSLTPCAPLASLFTNDTGLVAAANPTISDSIGNVSVWAAPAPYQVQYYGGGVTTSVKEMSIGTPGGAASFTSLTVSGAATFTGTTIAKQVNNVFSVDGVALTTIQACVNAASALSTPGKCFVPTGTAIASQVEMASGVTLEFASGVFQSTSAVGGIVVHFASSVTGATLRGQGVSTTTLKANSTGSQFLAVAQDEGIDNTVGDLTLDANGNATSTLVSLTTTRPKRHNLKLIADLTVVAGHNYAYDIRGGNNFEDSNIESVGGSLGGISIVTKDASGDYGSITGGDFTNLHAHNSPHNGLDINLNASAVGTANNLAALNFSNLFLQNNGTVNNGVDDEYGLTVNGCLLAGDSGGVNNLNFSNLWAIGNKGSGVRLKGCVNNTLMTVNSASNGTGIAGTVALDGIVLATGSGTTHPAFSIITATGNNGGATNFLSTQANSANNLLITNAATPVSLGSVNDVLLQGTAANGALKIFGSFTGSAAFRATQQIADQGTACTNGELALSAGWQSTGVATVTAAAGNGQTCSWTITTGTTTAANPTVTDTLTNPLPGATTVCWMNIYGGTHVAVAGESLRQTSLSATAPIFTANFTPTNTGATYFVTRVCGP